MWKSALRYSAVGLELGISVVIGYGFGWWLDRKFQTAPYLSLVGLLLGVAAGFVTLYRIAKELQKADEGEDS